MATVYKEFTGVCKWAKLKQPDNYGHYTIDLYLNDEQLLDFKATGLGLRIREDEGGQYVRFRRPVTKLIKNQQVNFGPPTVIKDGKKFDELVGNGSEVTVLVAIYDTQKGRGHTLEKVRVEKLVPYEGGIPKGWDYEEDEPAW